MEQTERQRLLTKITNLQNQWDLHYKKFSLLEKERITAIDPTVKFGLEEKIGDVKTEFAKVEQQLKDLESQLPPEPSESPIKENFKKILSELDEWKEIHHEAQKLYSTLNIPLDTMTRCFYKPHTETLDIAVYQWQHTFAPKFISFWKKLKTFKYADITELKELQEHLDSIDDITRQLSTIDVDRKEQIHQLYTQFNEIKCHIFKILDVADEKIIYSIKFLKQHGV